MSNPAVGAKYVAAVVVGLVGAGTFAGVSHDGRGATPPEDPEPIVEAPIPTSTAPTSTSTSRQVDTTLPTQPTEPAARAQPASPDPVPTRVRVRSRGS
jgi:hypothetical protein